MSANASTSSNNTVKVYLSLGTNLGDKQANLDKAEQLINERAGRITARSLRFENPPKDFVSDNFFINEALEVETVLSADELLECCCRIETEMGRKHKSINRVYSDRIIDIDIIFYGLAQISLPNLQIPHPRMGERDFVLIPLCDIAPDFIHPVYGISIKKMAAGLL